MDSKNKIKLVNLNLLLKTIEAKKNMVLINILQLAKQISFCFERSLLSKYYLESFINIYEIRHHLIPPKRFFYTKKLLQPKTIWVYVTEEEKYETNVYQRYESFLNKIDFTRDFFVCIGMRALRFAQKNKANIIFSHYENDIAYLSHVLPFFFHDYIQTNGFTYLHFVINSFKIPQKFIAVLPIENLNLTITKRNKETETKVMIKNLKIYPDIDAFVSAEFHAYLTYICLTLLSESALIHQKYQLVDYNQKISQIETKIFDIKRMLKRVKIEQEVEQIALLSQKKTVNNSFYE